MSESNPGHSHWGEYERLLGQHYPDLPDEWDLYEDTEAIRQAFAEGRSAQEVFDALHGIWFGRNVQVDPPYR